MFLGSGFSSPFSTRSTTSVRIALVGAGMPYDKGIVFSLTLQMDRTREDFFAGAAFSADQNGNIRHGHALDETEDGFYTLRYTDHAVKSVAKALRVLVDELV